MSLVKLFLFCYECLKPCLKTFGIEEVLGVRNYRLLVNAIFFFECFYPKQPFTFWATLKISKNARAAVLALLVVVTWLVNWVAHVRFRHSKIDRVFDVVYRFLKNVLYSPQPVWKIWLFFLDIMSQVQMDFQFSSAFKFSWPKNFTPIALFTVSFYFARVWNETLWINSFSKRTFFKRIRFEFGSLFVVRVFKYLTSIDSDNGSKNDD